MRRITGPQPKLAPVAIRRVLAWRDQVIAFRKRGSAWVCAQQQGLTLSIVIRALLELTSTQHLQNPVPPAGGVSRLRGPQCKVIARLQRLYPEFARNHISAAKLAAELGVSRYVIFDCLQRDGRYARWAGDSAENLTDVGARASLERPSSLPNWPSPPEIPRAVRNAGLERPRRARSTRKPK
jgi:hypothetical protein